MTLTLLPSAEATFVAWAVSVADITAITGQRVGTNLDRTLPAIRISRIGDPSLDVWQDNASLQVECWAASQSAADTLIRTVVAALPAIRGYTHGGGKVNTYQLTSGPFWSPDDPTLSDNARYIVTVSLLVTTT